MVFWPREEVERMLADKDCRAQGWNQNALDRLGEIIEAAQADVAQILGKSLRFTALRLSFDREPYPTAFDIDRKQELINVKSTLHSPKRDGNFFFDIIDIHLRHDFGHFISYESIIPPARSSYHVAQVLQRGALNHPYLEGLKIDILKYWDNFDLNLKNLTEATIELVAHKAGVLLCGKEQYRKGYQKGVDYALREYRRRVDKKKFRNENSLPWLLSWQVLTRGVEYQKAVDEFKKIALKAVKNASLFPEVNRKLVPEFIFLWENIRFKTKAE